MSKTFSYEANTTTSTIQYNVTASIGSLSQEKTFSVPAGDECQDNYVLSAPSTVYYGWSAGSTESISITSTLNGKDYPYEVVTGNLTGATVSSSNGNTIITATQNGSQDPTLMGTITINQTQKDGQVNTTDIDVYQKGFVELSITSDGMSSASIYSDRPLPCNVNGVIENDTGETIGFGMNSGSSTTRISLDAMDNTNAISISDASLSCNDKYDIIY